MLFPYFYPTSLARLPFIAFSCSQMALVAPGLCFLIGKPFPNAIMADVWGHFYFCALSS
jgi:hypothetical protein